MLAHLLAIVIGLGSFVLYMAAFFFPEVYRRYDFVWSGIGLFYALVLWVCAGRITGGVLLGQTASVALLGWFGWQTLKLRRDLTPLNQQTPFPQKSASFGHLLQNRVAQVQSNAQGWVQGLLSPNKPKKQPVAVVTRTPAPTRRAAAPVSPPAYEVLDEFEAPAAKIELKPDSAMARPEGVVPEVVPKVIGSDAVKPKAPIRDAEIRDAEIRDAEVLNVEVADVNIPNVEVLNVEVLNVEVADIGMPAAGGSDAASLQSTAADASPPEATKAKSAQRKLATQQPKKRVTHQFTGLLTTARNQLQQSLRFLNQRKQTGRSAPEQAASSPMTSPMTAPDPKPETAEADWEADLEAWDEELTFEEIGETAQDSVTMEEETLLLRREVPSVAETDPETPLEADAIAAESTESAESTDLAESTESTESTESAEVNPIETAIAATVEIVEIEVEVVETEFQEGETTVEFETSIEQPTDQSADQLTDQSTGQSTDQSADQLTDQLADQPTEQPTEQPDSDRGVADPLDDSADSP